MDRRKFLTMAAVVPGADLLSGAGLPAAAARATGPALTTAARTTGRTLTTAARKNILADGVADQYIRAVKALKAEPSTNGLPSLYDEYVQAHFDVVGRGTVHHHPAFLPWHRAFLMDFEKECQRVLGDPGFGLPYWDWTADSTKPDSGGIWSKQILGGAGSPVKTGPFAGKANWSVYSPNGAAKPELHRALSAADTATKFPTRAGVHALYLNATYEKFWGALEWGYHDWVHDWIGGQMGDVRNSVNDPAFWLHHCNVDRVWAQWQYVYPKATLAVAAFPGFSATASMPATRPGGAEGTVGSVLDAAKTAYHYDDYYRMTSSTLIFKISTTSAWFSLTGTNDQVDAALWLGRPGETSGLGVWSQTLDKAHCDHKDPFENGKVDTFRYPDSTFTASQSADLTGLLTPVCLQRMSLHKYPHGGAGDDWTMAKFEISGEGWTIASPVLDIDFTDNIQGREFNLAPPKF